MLERSEYLFTCFRFLSSACAKFWVFTQLSSISVLLPSQNTTFSAPEMCLIYLEILKLRSENNGKHVFQSLMSLLWTDWLFCTPQEAMTLCMQSREHQYIFEPVCASVLLRRNTSKEPLRSRNSPRIEGHVQLEPMSLRLSQVCWQLIFNCLHFRVILLHIYTCLNKTSAFNLLIVQKSQWFHVENETFTSSLY